MANSTINNKMTMWTKIWVDDDPTVAPGEFSLNIDLSKYSWLLIGIKISSTANPGYGKFYEVPIDNTTDPDDTNNPALWTHMYLFGDQFFTSGNTATPYIYTRKVRAWKTGIDFTNGFRHRTNGTTAANISDGYCMPIVIYAR